MFRACTFDEIEEILARNPIQYFDEREELEDLADDKTSAFYRSEDCLVVTSPRRLRMEILAMPLKPEFNLAALEQFAHKKAANFRMHLNVTGIEVGKLRFTEPYDISDPITSLWGDQPKAPAPGTVLPEGKIRTLTSADSRHIMNFPQEAAGRAMNLKQIFPLLVVDEIGSILGFFNRDGAMLGYISYMPSAFDSLTIDEVCVLPPFRLQGIGSMLAREVLATAARSGNSAYWPVADSVAAIETAEAAGFHKVGSRITIETL